MCITNKTKMDPFAKLVKTFITDHPELAPHVLEAGGEYTGTCKKSRKPKKGKCKPGFEIYDRPLDDGKFEKCCFRLAQRGKEDADYMASLVLRQEEISKRGKSFFELLQTGDYVNTVFIDQKKVKNKKGKVHVRTKEYRFTEKSLRRKILSLRAKWNKIEDMKKKKQKNLGINNFTDDSLLYIQGAMMAAKENTLSGGGSFTQAIWKCASAFLNAIVSYFKNLIMGGGGIIQSLKQKLRWFIRNFKFYLIVAVIAGVTYLVCDNTLHRMCQGITWENNKLGHIFCSIFGWDTSKMFGLGATTKRHIDYNADGTKKKKATLANTFFASVFSPVLGGIVGASKIAHEASDYFNFADAYWMDKNNPLRILVASKWKDADGNDTTCQYLFNSLIVQGLFGMTVTSTLQAWMNVGRGAVNIGTGVAGSYLTGNPAMAIGALMQEGKKGANAYMNQSSFLENRAVQSLGSAAMATGVKYASTNAYSLEKRQMELEESIQKMIQAKASGIPIDERVLARQRQELNRVAAQIAGINEQKSSQQANIQKGMDVAGQANAMGRNVIMSQVNAGIDVANTAASAWGAKMQKRELTEQEKSLFSGIQKGTDMASDIATSFGKPVSTEALGTAVTSFVGSKYHGESTGVAAQKAQQAFKTNALTHLQSRKQALTNAASAAYGMIPEKYHSVPGKETPSGESKYGQDNLDESKQGEEGAIDVKTETLDQSLQRDVETATAVVSGRCSKVTCKLGKLRTPKGNRCCRNKLPRKKLRGGDVIPFLVGCEFLM